MGLTSVHILSSFVHRLSIAWCFTYVVDIQLLSIVSIVSIGKIRITKNKKASKTQKYSKCFCFALAKKSAVDTVDAMDSIETQWLIKNFPMVSLDGQASFAMDRSRK